MREAFPLPAMLVVFFLGEVNTLVFSCLFLFVPFFSAAASCEVEIV